MNYVAQVLSSVRNKFTKYKSVFCANVKAQLAYRGIVLEIAFYYIMECVLLVFLWRAIYSGNHTLYGRTLAQMKGYLLASSAFSSIYSYPSIHFLSLDIRNGEIAYTLSRPIDFQAQFIFKNLGRTVSSMLVIAPFYILLSLAFGATPSGNAFFTVSSLAMGILLCISFDFCLGVLCFWTENSWGVSLARQIALQYLSGAFVPLDCFPPQIAKILRDYFPFSGIVYFPVQFATQRFSMTYFLDRVKFQAAWCLMFLVFGRLLYLLVRRITTVNGG